MKLLRILMFLSLATATVTDIDGNVNNLRIDCTEICDEEEQSSFVCEICEENKRILQKCSPTNKYFNHVDATEELILRQGIQEYCNSSNLEGDIGNYFDLSSLNNYTANIIKEYNCWDDNTPSDDGDCGIDTEPYANSWGLYLNDTNYEKNISIHVNHPLHDRNTPQIASYLFEYLNAKWMLVAGAHRYSYVNISTDDCEYCFDEPENFGADVARYIASSQENSVCEDYNYITPFQIFHEEISSNINCTDVNDSLLSLSIHGFDNNTYPNKPTFIMTNGNNSNNECKPPDIITSTIYHKLMNTFEYNEYYDTLCVDTSQNPEHLIAVIVQQEINCSLQSISCGDSEYSPYSLYSGYSNPQGRYTNNTDLINLNTDNDTWLQIEIDKCIRDNHDLYKLTAEIISDAISDCQSNPQNCFSCDSGNPCSSYDITAQGVNYEYYDYTCDCLIGIGLGDVNQDCSVNVSDIVKMIEHIFEDTTLEANAYNNADYNQDGIINVVDVVQIVQLILDGEDPATINNNTDNSNQ